MVRFLAFVSSAAFFIGSAHADLLLMPKVSEYRADGATFKHLVFSDGDKTVTYESPRGWEYFGSTYQLTLRPPGKAQADAAITRIPLSQPGSFDEESLKNLVSDAMAQLPKGSENISVVSQEKNLLTIEHKETFLITLSYTFYGEEYGRSILFLNRGNEQIRCQLTSRQADFKGLHAAFLRSQYTWQNL